MTSVVSYEVRDRIGYLTLDRPEVMNAINEDVLEAFPKAVASAARDREIKALVVSGAGDAFCVGLDIDLLRRAFDDLDYFHDVLQRFKRLLLDVEAAPFPVVAAVNGLARAGGFELMLACDLVVVADDARIGDTHLAFGIVPGGGATQRAPRKIGIQRARELIFTGRWMNGSEAASIGLALRSVPAPELETSVEQLVSSFRSLSRPCLAETKAAMNEGMGLALEQGLDVEIEHFIAYLKDEPTSREGYLAYLERRAPSWP